MDTCRGIPTLIIKIQPESIWARERRRFRVDWDYDSITRFVGIGELPEILNSINEIEPPPNGGHYTVVISGL